MKFRFVLAFVMLVIAVCRPGWAETRLGRPVEAPLQLSTMPPNTFNVVLAMDARHPKPADGDIRKALKLAEEWIERWYDTRAVFKITRRTDVAGYLDEYFRAVPVQESARRFPYRLDGTDTVARFIGQQMQVLQSLDLDAVRAYAPENLRAGITSPRAGAEFLLNFFDQRMQLWLSLKSPGKRAAPIIDRAHPEIHSYWYWNAAFRGLFAEDIRDHLIITNVLFIDDALWEAPPHSMVRGGILNGMAEVEAPQTIVSTFPVYTDIPEIAALRDGPLSRKDRIRAIAQIVAHEVGTHILHGYVDIYDHKACLAQPTSGLNYNKTLTRLFDGPVCSQKHPVLDLNKEMSDRLYMMARRLIDAGDDTRALDAVRRLHAIDPDRPTVRLMLKQLEAGNRRK